LDIRESLPSGTLLDGSYRIIRVVGSGGFGITYEAEDVNLGTSVAVKEYYPFDFGERAAAAASVRPKSLRHQQAFDWGRSNFLREARTLARFEHMSIVRVLRVFEAHSTAYMVMRFEQGQSFESWLKSLGRQPTQEELDRIVAPLLDALEMLHGSDFLHRDIAPDNIIVRPDGTPVLLDFGAARHAVAEISKVLTGIVKEGYSPLEQYRSDGRGQGPWTDIYALGGTLYRAIAGEAPHSASLRFDDDHMPPAVEVGKDRFRRSFLVAIDASLKVRSAERLRSIPELRHQLLAPEERRTSNPIAARIGQHTVTATRKLSQLKQSTDELSQTQQWLLAIGGFAAIALGLLYFFYTYLEPRAPVTRPASSAREDPADTSRRRQEEEARKQRDEELAQQKAAREREQRQKEEARRQAEEDERARQRAQAETERRRKAEQDAAAKKAADEAAARVAEAATYLERGKALVESGDSAGAISALDRAIQLNPKLGAAYWQRGIAYANRGDHDQAIKDYDEAIAADPRPEAYYARASSLSVRRDFDRAIADLDEAIRRNPKMAAAYWQRGVARANKGEHVQAIADYDEAIRLDPKMARVYLSRGNSYELRDDFDRARTDYDEAIRRDPQLSDAFYARGFLFSMRGELDQAISDYDAALRLNPDLASAYWRRGTAHSMKADYELAIKDFNEAIRLTPQLAGAYWQRGVAYANKGDTTRAMADYNEAIRLDPWFARVYLDRGNLYASRGDHTKAITDFDEAIRLDGELAGAYYARGNSYTKKGNRTRALEDYRKTLQLDPNHQEARRELQGAPRAR
jgi:tetratricopeptide (TPR) repeat protein